MEYSLLFVTGLTVTSESELDNESSQGPVNQPSVSQMLSKPKASDPEDVPLSVLANQEKLRKAKG